MRRGIRLGLPDVILSTAIVTADCSVVCSRRESAGMRIIDCATGMPGMPVWCFPCYDKSR